MFEKTKIKSAARRVKNTKRTNRRNVRNRRPSFWKRIWNFILWSCHQVARLIRWVWAKICQFASWLWKKICEINLVGLLNLTLLLAIFVLCTMLIIDITNCRKKPVVIISDPATVSSIDNKKQNTSVVPEPITKPVSTSVNSVLPRTKTLPIVRNEKTKAMNSEPIRVNTNQPTQVAQKQIATCNEVMYGDIVIDNRDDARLINNGTKIKGNLYLQNMRKFVLPCDVKITGNMFIRDVNMVQFCGDFEITGNIYVSPRSSFGPIPSTARLGGHVIL